MFDLEHEPSLEELAGIEGEWSVIAAEVAVVTAECRVAEFGDAVSVRAESRAAADLAAVRRSRVRVSGSVSAA